MKLLIEEHPYDEAFVKSHRIFDGLAQLEDIHQKVSISYVGYFYSPSVKDCVFILPKVLMKGERVFGEYSPEELIDVDKSRLKDHERKFIYEFAVWIYRAIAVFNDCNKDNDIVLRRELAKIGHGCRRVSNSFLDILLSLIQFNNENKDYIMFVVKNLHSGHNKINWTRTISKSQTFVQNGSPIYLNPVNKKRKINFDEELLVIFYSILRRICQKYGFRAAEHCNFALLNDSQMDRYEQGYGKQRLLQIKYKYFSDKALRIWELCYAYFDRTHEISVTSQFSEYLLVKNFYVVFEAIIDELIGDKEAERKIYENAGEHIDDIVMQKRQRDGKRVDHIFKYAGLTQAGKDQEIYYIGDSKYYKIGYDLGEESVFKQYTYARNVIQWNIDLWKSSNTSEGIRLRDEETEGYNIIPNFFISAFMDENFNYDDAQLRPAMSEGRKVQYVSSQFDNRLFDRDTLLLSRYNVNFLFVVKLYARNDSGQKCEWRKDVYDKFRGEVQAMLQERFDFYAMAPKGGNEVQAQDFLQQHFREVLGKVFRPYTDAPSGTKNGWYVMALEKPQAGQSGDGGFLDMMKQAFDVDPIDKLGYEPKVWTDYRPMDEPKYFQRHLDDPVFVGYVKANNKQINLFKQGRATSYYTGTTNVPNSLDLQKLRFFVPVVTGDVMGVYEVKSVRAASKRDQQLEGDNADSVRFILDLGSYHPFKRPKNAFHSRLHDGATFTMQDLKTIYEELPE